jgi:hypothetical protein
MYNDAKVNVLEEALQFQSDHRSKGIKRERRNPKCKGSHPMDSTRLA